MFGPDLEKDYNDAQTEFNQANLSISLNQDLVNNTSLDETQKIKFKTDLALAKNQLKGAIEKKEAIEKTFHMVPGKPGFFTARTPAFDAAFPRFGVPLWTVLNDDRTESLRGRTVRSHEELLRVGNIEGKWHVELKIPQRNIGQIRRAFVDPQYHKVEVGTGKKYLDVDVLLSSEADTSYLGRLYEDGVTAQAMPNKNEHDENEPVVTAYVKLNVEGIPRDKWVPTEQFVTGLEIRTRIRCGDHALGYSLFHGVWEWFYEKVVFFF